MLEQIEGKAIPIGHTDPGASTTRIDRTVGWAQVVKDCSGRVMAGWAATGAAPG
jgi:hypothetical protein